MNSFEATIDVRHDWWLVIADDGSTDGSRELAAEWATSRAEKLQTVLIQNHAVGIAGQTNSIFQVVLGLRPDLAFVCNDDLTFLQPGWADLWHDAVTDGGYEHLVFFDDSWREAQHRRTRGSLESLTDAANCQGALFTVTPRLLEAIGLFDERNFPVRGHSHIDFTTRACRAGANELETLWDVANSSAYVRLQGRDDYQETFDWNSSEARHLFTSAERRRRLEVIANPKRVRVEDCMDTRDASRVAIVPQNQVAEQVMATRPLLSPSSNETSFDRVIVLNLIQQVERWDVTAAQLSHAGFRFERFPAVYGYRPDLALDWQTYNMQGFQFPIEQKMGRRLIQSPGAWGYLLSMKKAIRNAVETRRRELVVFDDDVRLHKEAECLVAATLRDLPEDWVLWYLGSTQKDWSAASMVGERLLDTAGQADGSFAVAVRESAFDLILEEIDAWQWPYDSGPLRSVCRHFPNRSLASFPPIAIADVSSSIIREPRDSAGFADAARWPVNEYYEREVAHVSVQVVVTARHNHHALRATLESLCHQDTPGFRTSVLIPVDTTRQQETLAMAQVLDTRVTGWASVDGDVGAGEVNALLDIVGAGSVLLIEEGTVLPRDGVRSLLEAADSETPKAAVLNVAVAPTVVDAATVDRSDLYSRAAQVDGPTLFNQAARQALGDARASGLAGSLEWRGRHAAAGRPVQYVHAAGLGIQPVGNITQAEQIAIELVVLPDEVANRPFWSGQRSPIRRILSLEVE